MEQLLISPKDKSQLLLFKQLAKQLKVSIRIVPVVERDEHEVFHHRAKTRRNSAVKKHLDQ
jgi:hypothetical protein